MSAPRLSPAETAEQIRQAARSLGYVACGFTDTSPFVEYEAAIARLIREFPDAAALYERFRFRVNPCADAPWAKTLVVAVRRYGDHRLPRRIVGYIGRNYLFDRRLAAHPDHIMPRRMTEALRAMGLRVKRGSGTSDRWAAARAGVVRLARNTFAVTKAEGSWINIECWRVDAELPSAPPTLDDPCPPRCRRCLNACRTGALCAPRVLRMDRCVAWLTYAAPWPIAPDLWSRMGTWIYGCDDCQTACPLNKDKWVERRDAPWLDALGDLLTPEGIARMSDEEYRERLHPLFWYIPPDRPDRWRAQARRALCDLDGKGEPASTETVLSWTSVSCRGREGHGDADA